MWFSNFIWEIRIPWGISPLTLPTQPHLCDAKTVSLGWRPTICIFMGFWVVVFAESTNLCTSSATLNRESCTLKKPKDWTGEGKENKSPVLLQFEQSPGRLLSMPPTYRSRQSFASPAQPCFAGKYGVIRPCLSALCSPLPWLCFDRCVRGWRSRCCQLSPCQERGAGGRPGGSAQPLSYPGWRGSEPAGKE